MEIVFILLPLALLIAGVILALFVWVVRAGQFDDLEILAVRILFEDLPRRCPAKMDTDPKAAADTAAELEDPPASSAAPRFARPSSSWAAAWGCVTWLMPRSLMIRPVWHGGRPLASVVCRDRGFSTPT